MRKQQKIWLEEHKDQLTIPGMASTEPASSVVAFTDWLRKENITLGDKAVDIGCGKGRNSIYLASLGLQVWGLDYIESALTAAKQLAEFRQLHNIHFKLAEIDKPWEFPDNFFDIAIDSFSSIDIETKSGREIYRSELYRTLKPGGIALITVVSNEDEWEKGLISTNPGAEYNSTLWPQTGKFQKNYDETELREFYKIFEIVSLEKISKPAFKLGKHYQAINFWLVIKK